MMVDSQSIVSIVVVNAYGVNYLRKALDSIISKTRYPMYEIIVIDCMTPKFEVWIERYKNKHPSRIIKYLHLDYDIGASAEHNVALKLVDKTSKVIVFLDNDVEIIDGNWLNNLVYILEKSDATIVSPILVMMDNKNKIQYAGGFLLPDFVSNYSLTEEIKNKSIYYESFSFSGAAFAIKKSVLKELERFGLPLYLDFFFICRDDLELSIRLRSRGHKILITRNAKIAHKGGDISAKDYHYLKNSISILLLYVNELRNLIKILPYSVCSLIIHELILLRKYRVNIFLTVLRVLFWLTRNFKLLISTRHKISKYRRYNDFEMFRLIYKLLIQNNIVIPKYIKSELARHYKWAVIVKLRTMTKHRSGKKGDKA